MCQKEWFTDFGKKILKSAKTVLSRDWAWRRWGGRKQTEFVCCYFNLSIRDLCSSSVFCFFFFPFNFSYIKLSLTENCKILRCTLWWFGASLIAQLVKNPPAMWFLVRKIRWRRDRLPTPVFLGFPCGLAGKESTSNARDLDLIPGLGRSPGEGKG